MAHGVDYTDYYGRPTEQDRPLYFRPAVSFLLLSFFSSPNLSGYILDVYHLHMVWP